MKKYCFKEILFGLKNKRLKVRYLPIFNIYNMFLNPYQILLYSKHYFVLWKYFTNILFYCLNLQYYF